MVNSALMSPDKIPEDKVNNKRNNPEVPDTNLKKNESEETNKDVVFLRAARQTFRSIYGSQKPTQLFTRKEKQLRTLKSKKSIMLDPSIMGLFENRARGVELWGKARKHFMNQKVSLSLPEALEKEMLHKGRDTSVTSKRQWIIHPDSWIKLIIYLIKIFGVLYNFFYIQIM